MFDLAWSQIMLIGIVALVAIGPKDLPVAMKAIAGMIKKARGLATEFQSHVDDMMKDTDLAEVRREINEIRNFDFKGTVERAVDSDGTIRSSFSDPFTTTTPAPTTPAPEAPAEGATAAEGTATAPETPPAEAATEAAAEAAPPAPPPPPRIDAPAFIPPEFADKCEEPPAFIPPGVRPPAPYYYTTPSS